MRQTKARASENHCPYLIFTFCNELICSIEYAPVSKLIKIKTNEIIKIQRQFKISVIVPPKTGPKATAHAVIIVPIPIIKPIFSLGTSVKIILYISGNPIPVPTPCSARPSSNKSKRGVIISIINPKANNKTPKIKICLVDILNLIWELIGTIVAITNNTRVFTHCT